MTRRKLWTEELDNKLLAHVNARGKQSIPDACATLRVLGDPAFQDFTPYALVKHYEKLRHAQDLELQRLEQECEDEEEEESSTTSTSYRVERVIPASHGKLSSREHIGCGYLMIPTMKQVEAWFYEKYGRGAYVIVDEETDCVITGYYLPPLPHVGDEPKCLGLYMAEKANFDVCNACEFAVDCQAVVEEQSHPECFGTYKPGYCSTECGFVENCDLATPKKRSEKFTVTKMMKVTASGGNGPSLVRTVPQTIGETYVGEPPTKDEIEALLTPLYGGGEYIVINQTTKKVHKRFRFDGPPKDPDAPVAFSGESLSPIVQTLDVDKHPLMRALLLLPEAKDNQQAWGRIFPRVLKAAEGVCADIAAARKDIAAARKELEKVAFATKVVQTLHADKLEAVMDECDAAMERNKLVDRELKKEN